MVSVIKAVTWLGSNGVLWTVTGLAAVALAIRRRWRLAVYLLVAGAGALTLDPVLKSLVGRLRPVVAHPVAYGTGDSFPSGHALGSIVCYGALFLVFLPATRGTVAPPVHRVIVTLIVAIGVSRLLLGVHLPLGRARRLGARHHLAGRHRLRLRTVPPGRRGTGGRADDRGP